MSSLHFPGPLESQNDINSRRETKFKEFFSNIRTVKDIRVKGSERLAGTL
jgi:hypothetical protein